MTEQEREEIVRQMAVAIRKQKFARTGRIGCFDETNITDDELSEARAALAVAEPVIREQADNALREENARLREVLKPFAYIAEHVGEEDALWAVPSAHLRAARAAIREGGKDE